MLPVLHNSVTKLTRNDVMYDVSVNNSVRVNNYNQINWAYLFWGWTNMMKIFVILH